MMPPHEDLSVMVETMDPPDSQRTKADGQSVDEEEAARLSVRRWMATSAVSITACASAFTWLVTNESLDLFRSTAFSNFYDVQARAMLHGHWDMSPKVLWIEGGGDAGLTYMYCGPVPALLRIPVLLGTSRLDGKLAELPLLLAFVVAL